MGFLIWLLSAAIGIVLLPVGILFGLVLDFYKRHFNTGFRNANKKFLKLATAFDKYGNVVCSELFNTTLIKKNQCQPLRKY
jgi:hypothetical protein